MSRFDDLILGQPLPATISCDFPLRFNGCRRGGLLYSARSRDFAQPVVAAAAAARCALDKHEITNRVLGLLRSFPFVDPAKLKQENKVQKTSIPLFSFITQMKQENKVEQPKLICA